MFDIPVKGGIIDIFKVPNPGFGELVTAEEVYVFRQVYPGIEFHSGFEDLILLYKALVVRDIKIYRMQII